MPTIRHTLSVLVAIAGAWLLFTHAEAAAPQLKTQAPGFYRMMLGDFEITALSDGVFDLQTRKMLTDATPTQLDGLLARSFETDAVPTSVNAYLINTGDKLVLVDTGAAKLFGPTLGNLLANFAASGYRPEQVDAILITHMHPDHIGGFMADGNAVFPNATVYADQHDAGIWLSAVAMQKSVAEKKYIFQDAAAAIAPYSSAGRFKPFKGPINLFPGISAVPAPGHTPGHTIYAIESKGQKLMLWGDLMEIASVQFVAPAVTTAYDVDAPESAQQRQTALADASRGRYLVGGAHLPFPGIGHVRSEHASYTWVPVDYDMVR